MRRSQRAMALLVVLMVSFVVLIFAFTGVRFTSENLFTVARAEARGEAFYAAQAGIYATVHDMERVGGTPAGGSRALAALENGATYQVDVAEVDRTRYMYRLTSHGKSGSTSRTLQVDISLDADSFQAMTSQGRIGIEADTFVNAIESTANPRLQKGNLHTNSAADDAIYYGTAADRLSVTGKASAVGGIPAAVIGAASPHADTIPPLTVNKSSLLSGSFTPVTPPPAGTTWNLPEHARLEVSGDLNFDGPLFIPEGSTLHVTGKLGLSQSVTGGGNLVVEGDTLIRGSDLIDLQHGKGVLLYSEGDVSVVHPSAARATQSVTSVYGEDDTSQETYTYTTNRIATYFAERPPDTEFQLRQNLPINAPTTTREFFTYYEQQQLTPSEAYTAWVEGDPSVTFTGISPSVQTWLNKAKTDPALHSAIQALTE